MIKTKEAIIDGKSFKITQLGYADGIELLTKLLVLAGAAFEKNEGKDSFSLARLAERISAADLKMVIEKLANRTVIEREAGSDKWPKLEPEVDLAGDYGLMFKWLKFALEVNYGGFFYAAGDLLKNGATLKDPALGNAV